VYCNWTTLTFFYCSE